ncbi:MAG: MoxR family ATPase [Dehalococcoidales bacterium]|nr:MoxR family ATPase [Dehalococcoidales bacterium]
MVDVNRISDMTQRIMNEVSKVVIGKTDIKESMMLALLAGGHILIEGYPGTAKTKLARSFVSAVGGHFQRIQFTPDMMPADVTGFYIYSPSGENRFVEGPIFANIVLADELNRTTPRTQAALLEAMQEHQVTIETTTYPLYSPFMVIATQVESGGEGTYPLTDVQVDRFLLRISSVYATKEEETQILNNIDEIDEPDIHQIVTLEEIIELQEQVKEVHVSNEVVDYITSITELLRADNDIASGPSIRGSIALYKCSRVYALFDGRDFVIPDDIKDLLMPTLEHRIQIRPEAEMDDITPRIVLERTLERVAVPKVNV